jgi:hypothetical protein
MTRYGISDPVALAEATRIARKAGLGYVMAMILCNVGRLQGYDLAGAQVFALTFAYAFFGVALATAGRRRMLITIPRPGVPARLLTIGMMGAGLFLLLGATSTLMTLIGILLGTPKG